MNPLIDSDKKERWLIKGRIVKKEMGGGYFSTHYYPLDEDRDLMDLYYIRYKKFKELSPEEQEYLLQMPEEKRVLGKL